MEETFMFRVTISNINYRQICVCVNYIYGIFMKTCHELNLLQKLYLLFEKRELLNFNKVDVDLWHELGTNIQFLWGILSFPVWQHYSIGISAPLISKHLSRVIEDFWKA